MPNSFFSRIRRWWDKLLFLLVFGVIILLSPGQNIYTSVTDRLMLPNDPPPLPKVTVHPFPLHITGVYPPDDISSNGIVVMDVDSGVIMYKKNETTKMSPASTTKILTALVALDSYKIDDVLTVKSLVNDGQSMGLFQGERMTVENLLYGALIHSGNDAAYVLADNYPGGVSSFISAMNQKARSLHLDQSVFTNPVGYDDPNHKMTPVDLARLAVVAMNNRIIAKMVAIPSITISDVTHTYFHALKNVNQLLGKIPGVSGIKTGWTEEAGENLVTLIERSGHRVVIVVLNSKDRFGDTEKLITWVFGNFQWNTYTPD